MRTSAVVATAFFAVITIFGASAGSAVIAIRSEGPIGVGLVAGEALAPGDPLDFGTGVAVGDGVGDGVADADADEEGDAPGLEDAFAPPEGDGAGVGRLKRSTHEKPPLS